MERIISKTKIIEFNGCCGCGKSTLAAVLGKSFKENTIRYLTLSELLNQNISYQNIFYYKHIVFELLKFCFTILPFRLNRIHYFKHVLKLHIAIELVIKEGRYDYILLDEGIVQGLSSIAYTDIITKKAFAKSVTQFMFKDQDYFIVNCNLDYNELLRRINIRKRNVGRIDQYFDRNEMLSVLKSQYKNLTRLRGILPNNVEIIDLNMDCETKDNVEVILDKIERK